ncbi:hypothetical protein N7495_004713 [Penicillium taxi]|uniref:uncharacterized protein n=1 Tax=Penicillium taxi TaxID=168475 RepID=UPI00254522F0|nr:uncharacterized protein N7495_004713 [Penicillium taxi]KAJ5899969.1 hypothetical protein N7495_004713 [Penicillium taxi]
MVSFSLTHLAASLVLCSSCALGDLIPSELSAYFSTNETLTASFYNGTDVITKSGQEAPISKTQAKPTLIIPDTNVSAPYIFVMVDPSYNSTVPTNTVLHTIAGNITKGDISGNDLTLDYGATSIAPYTGPEHKAGQSNHNYTLLLFSQPDNFNIPSKYDSYLPLNLSNVYTRVNFPVVDFVSDTGLGQPIAAIYFRLDLSSESSTTTAATTLTTATSTSSASAATFTLDGAGAAVSYPTKTLLGLILCLFALI